MERLYRENNPILRKLFLDIVPSSPADVTRRVNVFVEDGNSHKKAAWTSQGWFFLDPAGSFESGTVLKKNSKKVNSH